MKSPEQLEVGRRVRAFREARGWSQEQLGEHIGLHRTAVGHVERGELNIGLNTIVKLARGLTIDPGELLVGL
jgi:transcriptional regulator with XRE-family HTH domain